MSFQPLLVDLPGGGTLQTPGFLAVVSLAVVATFLLYTEHPQISRRAVVALVPWMVVGAGLSVLTGSVDYPSRVEPAVTGGGAHLTTYAVVCFVWFTLLQVMRRSSQQDAIPGILAAMGIGSATVILGTLIFRGDVVIGAVFWLAVAPIAAVAVAAVVLLLIGLWYPEAAAYTGMVGGLVVFGQAMSAIATVVAVVSGPGGHSFLSGAVLNLTVATGAAGQLGVDQQLLWAGGFVWTKLIIAILFIMALTAYTRAHQQRGNLVLGLFGAIGVVSGTTVLLSMVVG